MDRRTLLRATVLTGAAAGLTSSGIITAPAYAGSATGLAAQKKSKPGGSTRNIVYQQWTSDADFSSGTFAGVSSSGGALSLSTPIGQLTYTDPSTGATATYDYGTWTSPTSALGFAATNVIASWTADTTTGTWIQMEMRGVTALGNTTAWYVMGRWAADDDTISRTSLSGQSDTDGSISTDTFVAATGHGLTSVQLRVTLYRKVGSGLTPDVRSAGFVGSSLPGTAVASTPLAAQGIVLDVPRYSQDLHSGQYSQYGGGGEAWCSPTSSSMVIAYWGTGPTAADYAWVDPSYADPWVDYAARNCYDYAYGGTGNWPFNTAYGGRFGLDAFVTRLRSLNEVEQFIVAGVPLVLSVAFKKSQVPGLNYSTNGHLLTVVGFSPTGDPVLNDPVSTDDAGVRKTAGRAEFETAWLNASGGTVYVFHPSGHALPTPPSQPNW